MVNLIERIFQEPELKQAPPVLVDVGAAGGVTPIWRRIARYSIGLGFEPDARDVGRLNDASRVFMRWIQCESLLAPVVDDTGRKPFHLTRSPHCSSLLKPRNDRLEEWLFADHFVVEKTTDVAAVTLQAALTANGLERVDWLKCDTQGQDLSIFMSLPESWRRRVLAVEFEPGLIDAYEGEDKFWHTLRAMDSEPFWIAHLEVCGTQRGNERLFRRTLGLETTRWIKKVAPPIPGWVNVRYLRSLSIDGAQLDRRALLLAWVFADLLRQHSHGLMVAEEGRRLFGDDLFSRMAARSASRLRWAMVPKLPGWLWHRLGFGA